MFLQLVFAALISHFLIEITNAYIPLSAEKRLIKQLMDNYTINGKYERPIKSMEQKLRVGYGISLVQIIDVNAKDQVLTTNIWCKYSWRDETMTWNPIDQGNITIIRVPISSIWKPDMALYNYADERLDEHRHVMALIDPQGYVTYIPMVIFKSSCAIDTTNFPFDEQYCSMKFGSWSYDGNLLDPYFIDNKEFIELSEYVPSQEWVILEHNGKKNVKFYECCPNEPYPDLTFYLKLRRRATFYSYTLILPCVLLSFITMVTFILPPETPAKMLLGINVYIAFFTLLLLLRESTPPTSKSMPILGAYYCFNMAMTTISTFLCAVLVDMHYRADKRNAPSRLLTFIVIEIFAKAMFMYIPAEVSAFLKSQKEEAALEKLKKQKRNRNCSRGEHTRPRRKHRKQTFLPYDCVVVKAPKSSDENETRKHTRPRRKHRKQTFLPYDCVVVKAPKSSETRISLLHDQDEKSVRRKLAEEAMRLKQLGIRPGRTKRKKSVDNEEATTVNTPLRFDPLEGYETSSTLSDTSAQRLSTMLCQSPSFRDAVNDNSNNKETAVRLSAQQFNASERKWANLIELEDDNELPQCCHDGTTCNCLQCDSCRKKSMTGFPSVIKVGGGQLKTFSPTKRGVFVGATIDRCADCSSAAEAILASAIAESGKEQGIAEAALSLRRSFGCRPRNKPRMPRGIIRTSSESNIKHPIFPTISFDRKHYNKFDMSSNSKANLLASVISLPAKMERPVMKLDKTLFRAAYSLFPATPSSTCSSNKKLQFTGDAEAIKSELRMIHKMLDEYVKKIRKKEVKKRIAEVWRMISMVLDRLFFYGYILSMALSLIWLFPKRPPDLSEFIRYPNGTEIPQWLLTKNKTNQ